MLAVISYLLSPISHARADGTPTVPASQAEVNAGTVHGKYVAPDTLAGFPFVATNLSPATMTNVAQQIANTTSNLLFSTNTITATNQPFTVGQALVVVGTNGQGQPTVKGTNWPTGGGGGSQQTNTVTGGSNITATPTSTISGVTNTVIALSDPINLVQANAGTGWFTNLVTPTNAFAGTTVDFAHAEGTTNLGGNLTFTAIANATAGAHNAAIWHIYPGGSDRTIGIPTSWHSGRGDTLVVSNSFNHSDFLFTTQLGVSTNVAQRDYP